MCTAVCKRERGDRCDSYAYMHHYVHSSKVYFGSSCNMRRDANIHTQDLGGDDWIEKHQVNTRIFEYPNSENKVSKSRV